MAGNTSGAVNTSSIRPGAATGWSGATRDVEPAWQSANLPGWANAVIPWLVAGQAWPKASESGMWKMTLAYSN